MFFGLTDEERKRYAEEIVAFCIDGTFTNDLTLIYAAAQMPNVGFAPINRWAFHFMAYSGMGPEWEAYAKAPTIGILTKEARREFFDEDN